MIDLGKVPWDEIHDTRGLAFRRAYWTHLFLEDLPEVDKGNRELQRHLERAVAPCIARLKNLEGVLNALFVDKEEIVKTVIISAIAHQPLLVVGPPGTAKSKIILKFCEGLGLQRAHRMSGDGADHEQRSDTVFQYLLNGFTEPDEILGPVDINALRGTRPEYRRIREGSITDAVVIFLDEVFRGNSAILNALLSIMNERRIYEAGHVHPARARLFFGAANTVPSGRQLEDLRAFYERFVLRVESEPIATGMVGEEPARSRQELLSRGWSQEADEIRAGYGPRGSHLQQVASVNDILLLNRALADLWGGSSLSDGNGTGSAMAAFIDAYHRVVDVITKDELAAIDDRKFVRLFLLMRARSLYEHNGPPRIKDLDLLRHTWSDPAQKGQLAITVARLVADYSGPGG